MSRALAFASSVCVFAVVAEHEPSQTCSDDHVLLQTHRISGTKSMCNANCHCNDGTMDSDCKCSCNPGSAGPYCIPDNAWELDAECPSFTMGQFTVGVQGAKACPDGQSVITDAATCEAAAQVAGIGTQGKLMAGTGTTVNGAWVPQEFAPLTDDGTCIWAGQGSGLFSMGAKLGTGSKYICHLGDNCPAPPPTCDPSCDCNGGVVDSSDCSCECSNGGTLPDCIPSCAWDNKKGKCPSFTMGVFTVAMKGANKCPDGLEVVTDVESCRAAAKLAGFEVKGKVTGSWNKEIKKWKATGHADPVDGKDPCFWGGSWDGDFYLNPNFGNGAKWICQGGTCR